MKANPNFDYIHERIQHDRMVLLQGGTRSGKTRSCIDYIINISVKYSGMKIDICRDTFVALRSTVYLEFIEVLRELNISYTHNKQEHIVIINNNLISFYGLDNDEKVHGRERDIIWINEINQIKQTVFDQLAPRTRYRIIGDYNPRLGRKHWLDDYIKRFPPLITTYLDNPFLTSAQINDIESRKDNKYWWAIYGQGERAAVEGAIFPNWKIGEFDISLPFVYAIDWGYYPDPLALIKVAVSTRHKKIYVQEYVYATEINDVVEVVKNVGINKRDLIICDTSEPRAREAIKSDGYNIANAVKKKIVDDIRTISQYEIIVTKDSYNLQTELDNYAWNDKRSSIPIDDYNHCIDAMRYGFNRLTTKPSMRDAVYSEQVF